MILSRCPLRISLIGGGSDLPAFLKSENGKVISFTINKFVYIALHQFFAGGIRVSYSEQEQVKHAKLIKHPIIRETLLELNFNKSIELGSFADVPASGTGLGSSSSFTNALIAGLETFNRKSFTKENIARLACKIEIERCRNIIGFQDQWATAFGGLNLINFSNSEVSVINLNIESKAKDLINNSLRLFYLNKGRSSSAILAHVSNKILDTPKLRKSIRRSVELVPSMAKALDLGDAYSVGSILDEGWQIKQELDDSITNSEINEIYTQAKHYGAVGGKIVGAGGGGFLLLCIPQINAESFDRKFNYLRELKFSVEYGGVNIVYNDMLGN